MPEQYEVKHDVQYEVLVDCEIYAAVGIALWSEVMENTLCGGNGVTEVIRWWYCAKG